MNSQLIAEARKRGAELAAEQAGLIEKEKAALRAKLDHYMTLLDAELMQKLSMWCPEHFCRRFEVVGRVSSRVSIFSIFLYSFAIIFRKGLCLGLEYRMQI